MTIQFKSIRTTILIVLLLMALFYAYVKKTMDVMFEDPELQATEISIHQIMNDNNLTDYLDRTSGLLQEYRDTCDENRFQDLLPSILSVTQNQVRSFESYSYKEDEHLALPFPEARIRSRSLKAILSCYDKTHPQIVMPSLRIMAQDLLLLNRYANNIFDYSVTRSLATDILDIIDKHELMTSNDLSQNQELLQILKLIYETFPSPEEIIELEIQNITQILSKLESRFPLIMAMYALRYGYASTAYNTFMSSEFSFEKLLTIHPIAQMCVANVPQFRQQHEDMMFRLQSFLKFNP
ncbi:MAG: hypothetical protein H3C47_14345 [Candidatus Cloacimonetes bacterium]|nr:hypothetical protein [Candidatus Cloacimonadota bacterium]